MNPEIKQLWVAALRSGEYKQAQGNLRTQDNKFCCLGVLCNLHAQAHPNIAKHQIHKGSYMGSSGIPPDAVLKWAGLPTVCSMVAIPANKTTIRFNRIEPKTLGGANDSGATFEQIADLIERHL